MTKRYGLFISSRGWNKKGLRAARPLKSPRRILTVSVLLYQGRKRARRSIVVDKMPVGRARLYEVSVYYEKHLSTQHLLSTLEEVEKEVNHEIEYFGGGVAPWEFRVQVLRNR